MADPTGYYPMKWSGYGSLAMAYELPTEDAQRPASPLMSNVASPLMIPKTPPLWTGAYAASSSSGTASPVTPMASFALYSPTAFHSPQLNCSMPPHFYDCSTASTPPFQPQSPLSPSASLYSPRTPARPLAEQPAGRQVRLGPVIPQKAYTAPFSPGHKPMQIDFRFAKGGLGIPMRLLRDAGAMDLPIEGADTIPFSESVASTITLRIWWPGYVQYSRRISMRKATRLLMHSELAMAVSDVYKEFIEEAREDPKDPGQSKWRVGRGHITVNDLVLLRMFQVSQGSWQADVRLETAR